MRPLSTLLSPASIVMAISTAGLGQWIWMVHCCHHLVNIVIHNLSLPKYWDMVNWWVILLVHQVADYLVSKLDDGPWFYPSSIRSLNLSALLQTWILHPSLLICSSWLLELLPCDQLLQLHLASSQHWWWLAHHLLKLLWETVILRRNNGVVGTLDLGYDPTVCGRTLQ